MSYTNGLDDPSAYFHIKLYNGNGSTQSITNDANAGDFKPDWLWTKSRNDAFDHITRDSSRGVSQRLITHSTAAEDSASGTTSFDTNGFSLDSTNTVNKATDNYVAWQWKAGGSTVSNSDGSISSQVNVNTTAGFSIVTYTGTGSNATVGHGLGATPNLVIVKNRDSAGNNWFTHWTGLLSSDAHLMYLASTDAEASNATGFNSTAPTSSVFSVGTNTATNENTSGHVAYCFAEKQGYSKIGVYTGNGSSTNGSYIYTGFRPAFILWKQADTAGSNWGLRDNKRGPFNPTNDKLLADTSAAETEDWNLDLLSNGFKWYDGGGATNQSGSKYIYYAVAEHPFVSSEGVPTTAR